MTPSDQPTSSGSGSLALKADTWPEETIPENPQVSYYRARYYDSSTGRLLSEDPLGFNSDANFYEYAYQDPVDFDDPGGLNGQAAAAALGGAGTAVGWGGTVLGSTEAGAAILGGIVTTGAVVGAGAVGWLVGRGIGHIPIGGGNTVDSAVTAGFTATLIFFAQRGKQNISNEWVDNARKLFGNNKDKICAWLAAQYAIADGSTRLKIKVAQKFFGCRRCSLD